MLQSDVIVCEFKLPLPDDVGELCDIVWEEVEFSTISFGDSRDSEYVITNQGKLYKYNITKEWIEDLSMHQGGYHKEKARAIERQDYTGEISFASYFSRDKNDYIVCFTCIFVKGDLDSIKIKEFTPIDNVERIVEEKAIKIKREKRKKVESSFWFPIYLFYRKGVMLCFFFIRFITGCFVKLSWKMERFLIPY